MTSTERESAVEVITPAVSTEFLAVRHGLAAALKYVRSRPSEERPGVVVMHMDNTTVYELVGGFHVLVQYLRSIAKRVRTRRTDR